MRNYISQPLNLCGVTDVKHIEIYMAKSLISKHILFGKESTIKKLKRYIFPCTDQLQHNLSKQKVKHYILRSTNFGHLIWNKEQDLKGVLF
jgi:hypothetical protein